VREAESPRRREGSRERQRTDREICAPMTFSLGSRIARLVANSANSTATYKLLLLLLDILHSKQIPLIKLFKYKSRIDGTRLDRRSNVAPQIFTKKSSFAKIADRFCGCNLEEGELPGLLSVGGGRYVYLFCTDGLRASFSIPLLLNIVRINLSVTIIPCLIIFDEDAKK
jgi:hypothetical protein